MTYSGPSSRHLNQDVTYWGPGAPDGYGGRTYDSPVALSGRWEDKIVQFMLRDGNLTVSNSVVYLGQDVEVDGYLYLGTSVDANPKNVSGAYPIRQFTSIPDLRNLTRERKAFL